MTPDRANQEVGALLTDRTITIRLGWSAPCADPSLATPPVTKAAGTDAVDGARHSRSIFTVVIHRRFRQRRRTGHSASAAAPPP